MCNHRFMATNDLDTAVIELPSSLSHPEPASLLWTATNRLPQYEQLATWLELDILLVRLGQPGFDFVIVDDTIARRFAQAKGGSDGMNVEVCDYTAGDDPAVWRLHRASEDRLADAELTTHLVDGDGDGMHTDTMFTATEAASLLKEWLTTGTIAGVAVDAVDRRDR